MANSRFGVVNAISDGIVTNGDGTGPARTESAPFVMERAIDGNRASLWVPGAQNQDTGATWELTLDFGSPRGFTMAAALAVEGNGLGFIKAGRYSTYASVKDEVSLVRNGRDWGESFPQKTGQYWFFNIFATELLSVGDFFLGSVSDLGVVGLPDFTSTPFRVRDEEPQDDGSFILNDTGRMGHEFEMTFYAKDLTELAKYEALIASGGSIVHLDERNRCFEVLIVGGRLPTTRRFTGRNVTLRMVRQP